MGNLGPGVDTSARRVRISHILQSAVECVDSGERPRRVPQRVLFARWDRVPNHVLLCDPKKTAGRRHFIDKIQNEMAITTIAAGLSGLKAAAEMTKAIRDGLRAGSIKSDEIPSRIGEIYDYIVDSKAALVDAQDEILTLKKTIESFNDDKAFRDSLTFNLRGYYERNGTAGIERYCSACLDKNRDRVRITGHNESDFACEFHGYRGC